MRPVITHKYAPTSGPLISGCAAVTFVIARPTNKETTAKIRHVSRYTNLCIGMTY